METNIIGHLKFKTLLFFFVIISIKNSLFSQCQTYNQNNPFNPTISGATSISCGSSTTLTCSETNSKWYAQSTGGSPVSSNNTLTVSPTQSTTYYVQREVSLSQSTTFNFTGSQQTWVVPAGVTSISVTLLGAKGADGFTQSGANNGTGGKGGKVQGTYNVTPGQTIYVNVGGMPACLSCRGWNGGGNGHASGTSFGSGGGGGASDIRIGGSALSNRVFVAAGGGGAGCYCACCAGGLGGDGGGLTGNRGTHSWSGVNYYGTGGTQTSGGIGGGLNNSGSLGQGGDGNGNYYGAGGGGGYYGGGGGYQDAGGGGGSSYASPSATNVIHNAGFNSGNGSVVITYYSPCVSNRVAVNVTVNSISAPPNPTSNSPQCNSVTISRNGTPASGITWYWQGANSNGTSTTIGSGATYTANSSGSYYIRALNSSGCWSSSSGVAVNVSTPPTAPVTITGNNNICSGSSTTLTASGGTTGSGASFEWFSTACGTTVIGTSTSLTVSPTATTTYYVRRRGNSPCNNELTSCLSYTVNVEPAPTAPTTVSGDNNICLGESTTLTVSGGSDGTGATFEWFSGNCSSTVIGNSSTLSVSPNSSTTYYVRRRANASCNNITTSCISYTVNVTTLPSALVSPSGNQLLCLNSNLTLNANTGTGLSYQWILDGNNISNANNSQYSPLVSGQYAVMVSNSAGCTSTSNVVNVSQIIPVISGNTTVCSGDTISLSVNNMQNYTFSWQLNGNTIAGALDSVLSVSIAGNYSVIATNTGGCSGSSSVNVIAFPNPNVNIQSNGSTNICSNEFLNLSTSQTFQNYQWLYYGQQIVNAQSNNVVVNSTGNYSLFATDNNGCSNVSNSIFVNVRPAPNLSVSQIGSLEFCEGDSVVLSSSSSFGNIWSNGQVTQSITILNSGIYSLTLTDGICSATSQDYIVNVYQIPVIFLSDTIVDVNTGNNAMLSSSNAINNALYQWQMYSNGRWNNISDNSQFSGTTTNDLTVYNIDLNFNNRIFKLIAANNFCYDSSASVRLNVTSSNVAVEELTKFNFEVYPNPFSDEVCIVNHNYFEDKSHSIEFYNATGQLVMSTIIKNNYQIIFFEKDLLSGLYFLIVRDGENKIVLYEKLIKS